MIICLQKIDTFIKNDEGIMTIDIGDKLVREISNYIEVHFGIYMNGYNWKKFLHITSVKVI